MQANAGCAWCLSDRLVSYETPGKYYKAPKQDISHMKFSSQTSMASRAMLPSPSAECQASWQHQRPQYRLSGSLGQQQPEQLQGGCWNLVQRIPAVGPQHTVPEQCGTGLSVCSCTMFMSKSAAAHFIIVCVFLSKLAKTVN